MRGRMGVTVFAGGGGRPRSGAHSPRPAPPCHPTHPRPQGSERAHLMHVYTVRALPATRGSGMRTHPSWQRVQPLAPQVLPGQLSRCGRERQRRGGGRIRGGVLLGRAPPTQPALNGERLQPCSQCARARSNARAHHRHHLLRPPSPSHLAWDAAGGPRAGLVAHLPRAALGTPSPGRAARGGGVTPAGCKAAAHRIHHGVGERALATEKKVIARERVERRDDALVGGQARLLGHAHAHAVAVGAGGWGWGGAGGQGGRGLGGWRSSRGFRHPVCAPPPPSQRAMIRT